jgi:hypothetical protein
MPHLPSFATALFGAALPAAPKRCLDRFVWERAALRCIEIECDARRLHKPRGNSADHPRVDAPRNRKLRTTNPRARRHRNSGRSDSRFVTVDAHAFSGGSADVIRPTRSAKRKRRCLRANAFQQQRVASLPCRALSAPVVALKQEPIKTLAISSMFMVKFLYSFLYR